VWYNVTCVLLDVGDIKINIVSLYVHKPLDSYFYIWQTCFVLLIVVTIAHFGTAFWQGIFIILARAAIKCSAFEGPFECSYQTIFR
jgi:hypothetical protein